jgi:ABC-type glycerol-3-phosphate transport system permease component
MEGKRIRWSQLKYHWEIYLFIVPTLISIGLFIYYPAASGIYHSFFRWNGAGISEWLGLGNYIDLLSSSLFWHSFRNAFLLGMWNVVKMLPPLFVAVAIHRCSSTRMQFFYRVLFVIPMVVPPLIIALIWRSFFFEATSGYLNKLIAFVNCRGLLNTLAPLFGWGDVFSEAANPAWLGDPRLILTACVIWGFPWVSSLAVLTHLAKLQGISKDVYEAADIDGVSWWSKFTRVELPLITGSIYIMLVFTIIGTIKDAGMILALAGFEGGPGGRVDVPALFMLRKAFIDQKMGYACAAGIVLMVIVMALQKISTLVMDWRSLRRPWQVLLKAVVLIAGILAIGLGRLWVLGGALVLVALPYVQIRKAAAAALTSLPGVKPMLEAHDARSPSGAVRYQQAIVRRQQPLHRATSAFGDLFLRGSKHAYILMVLLFAVLPMYLMIIVSFKDNTQFYQAPTVLTHPMHAENWVTAWKLITPTIANSVFLSVSSTLLMLSMALMGAYFFARQRMPLSKVFWNAILVLMMLPMIANLVPLFRLLRDLNLLNTLSALILVGAAQGQIFAIFMLRNFISDIPQDLYEAAEIDGASHLRQMWYIVLPVSGPILGTVGVMHFMTAWNDFVLPLIVMRDHARLPVMVQLIRMAGEYIKLWGPLMAGYAMAAIPIIILFTFSMKLFVRGMTDGAVKG